MLFNINFHYEIQLEAGDEEEARAKAIKWLEDEPLIAGELDIDVEKAK
jgi:hypothetical protein